MLRLFFKIPFPFLFLLFLSSCSCKDDYYNFTEEELNLLVYKVGDVVKFNSNFNDIDTFICTFSDTQGYSSETAVGTTCSKNINSQLAASTIKSNNFKLGLAFGKKNAKDIEIKINFYLPDQIITDRWSLILRKSIKDAKELHSIVINGKEYKNVYVFVGEPNTDLSKIYYQKENGFLKFEMANGEFWEINK
jgi:hypothetical protein